MRLLHAKLANGFEHWINPAIYLGLEFIKNVGGDGTVLCYYLTGDNNRNYTGLHVLNVDELVREYQRIMRWE